MSEPSHAVIASVRMLTSFLFSALIVFVIAIGYRYPFLLAALGFLFLCIAIAGFVFSAIESPRYQNVFDYEAAHFGGKERNGKAIRNIIVTILVIAIWSLASAITMLAVSLPIIF